MISPSSRRPGLLGETKLLAFAGSQGISAIGDGIYLVALSWTALTLTHSPIYLGLLLTTSALPRSILMLGGGVLVDRLGARRVILGSDSTRAVLVVGLAVLVAVGHGSVAELFVVAALFGVFDALFYPATTTVIPALVSAEQLAAANGAWQVATQGSILVGPPLGGVILAISGPGPAFAADGATFLVAFLALLVIRVHPRGEETPETNEAAAAADRESTWNQLTAGIRTAFSDPFLRAILPLAAAVNFAAGGPLNVGLPLVARAHGWGPTGYGALFGGMGAGLLIGGIVMSAGFKLPRLGLSVMVGALLVAVPMAGIGLSPLLPVSVMLCALIGALVSGIDVSIMTLLQRNTPPHLLGRVSSVLLFFSMSLTPISYAVAGGVARALTAGGLFLAGAALVALVAGGGLLSKGIRTEPAPSVAVE